MTCPCPYLAMSKVDFNMSNDTFTIIQRTALDSWSIVDVVQGDIELACELAAMACNAAGVARTLVLDSLGSCVCIES